MIKGYTWIKKENHCQLIITVVQRLTESILPRLIDYRGATRETRGFLKHRSPRWIDTREFLCF